MSETYNSMCENQVQEYFPGAISLKKLEKNVTKVLKKYGIEPKNTLLSISSCADELERRLEKQFDEKWHLGFLFGGLSGFAFVAQGETGLYAALSHSPTGGNLLLIYCSHVGVSEEGIVGKVERRGIKHPDNCCGANIAAYNDKHQIPGDYQENYVKRKVNKHRHEFTHNEQQNMIELPNIIRHEIKKDIMDLLDESKTETPVILLGGININTKNKDYFVVYQFGIYSNGKFKDLLCKLNI